MKVTGVLKVVDPCRAVVESLGAILREKAQNIQMTNTNLRLSELVVMVGESQINTTRMNVHIVAKDSRRHDRALDMPARASRAPRRRPRRLTRLRRLPHRKVRGGAAASRHGQRALAVLEQLEVALVPDELHIGTVPAKRSARKATEGKGGRTGARACPP